MTVLRAVSRSETSGMDPRLLNEKIPLPGAAYDLSLAADLREHLVWMRLCGRSDRTLLCRRRAVVRLAEHLGHDPGLAEFEALYCWQLVLAQTSLHAVRWQTALVRPFFTWLHRKGRRADNPAALLPMPRLGKGLPRPMDETNVAVMIAEAPPRLLPWLVLAAWSGLRAFQIANLRVEDFRVDARGRVWVLVRGKGGDAHSVPVPSTAWQIVAPCLPESGPCWRRRIGIGPVTNKHVSEYCNRFLRSIGIRDSLHSLRHRAATLMLDASGRDVRLVQDFLGHAQLSTTQIYTKVNPGPMSDAAELLPPPVIPRAAGARHLRVVDVVDATTGGSA